MMDRAESQKECFTDVDFLFRQLKIAGNKYLDRKSFSRGMEHAARVNDQSVIEIVAKYLAVEGNNDLRLSSYSLKMDKQRLGLA